MSLTEWWLYRTEVGVNDRGFLTNTDRYFTPFAFEDGKLIGWGRGFCENKAKKYEFDVKIDQ